MTICVFRHLVKIKVASTSENKKSDCKQISCSMKFKHKTQFYRLKKCSAISPIKKIKDSMQKKVTIIIVRNMENNTVINQE